MTIQTAPLDDKRKRALDRLLETQVQADNWLIMLALLHYMRRNERA